MQILVLDGELWRSPPCKDTIPDQGEERARVWYMALCRFLIVKSQVMGSSGQKQAVTIQMSSCKDWKWFWPGKELGMFRTEASQGLTDDAFGILQHGFLRKQIYPARFGGHLFHPDSNGLSTRYCKRVFLSLVPFSFLVMLELYTGNIISMMLSLLPPKGTNSEMPFAAWK